ncbi:MAG: radical SAM protein [Candidatus Kaelpia imicola]|nr:radical SAM protein [Candidatus Kaelpia imicola]
MNEVKQDAFVENIYKKFKVRKPLSGQFAITYRCNFNCIHCYCKGSEVKGQELEDRELTLKEIKNILNQVYKEGCIWLCLTGGEPLLREDFLDIYSHAKGKGFLVKIFTNGSLLSRSIINYLSKYPPYSIEITLNGITKNTYETITRIPGSFERIMSIIPVLVEKKLPLILKTNGLKQNRDEILKIKSYAESLLGKHKFRFDSFVTARLDGSMELCQYRLEPEEILKLESQDPDMREEIEKGFHQPYKFERPSEYLYQCNAWLTQFFINPYGRLQFCYLTDRFSTDLKKVSFKEGFFNVFPQLLKEKFKTNSECKNCDLRSVCFHCPARTYLEAGNEEAPVEYFCRLAKAKYQRRKDYARSRF